MSCVLMLNWIVRKRTVYFFYKNGFEGARGEMVIVVGNEHGDSSSNPGREWSHFTLH